MAQVNLNSAKKLLAWVRIQNYEGSLLNKQYADSPLHWGLRAHTQDAPWPLASVPSNIVGHIQFTNWTSFVVSNLGGSLEQVELHPMSSTSQIILWFYDLCVPFWGSASWEVTGERWNIFLSYCTQPSWQLSWLHYVIQNQGEGKLHVWFPMEEWDVCEGTVFWGKLSLAHRQGVWWWPGICMLPQYNSLCGLLLFLLCSSIYKVPSANSRQNPEVGLLSPARASWLPGRSKQPSHWPWGALNMTNQSCEWDKTISMQYGWRVKIAWQMLKQCKRAWTTESMLWFQLITKGSRLTDEKENV